MEFIDRKYRVFRYDKDNKVAYTMGISKKKQDGSYEVGYMPIRFKKGTDLKDKTDIIIKEGWLDFYKIENKTKIYYFINKFELASDMDAMKQVSDNFDKVEELPFY